MDEKSSLLQQESLLNSELQKFFRNAPDNIPDGMKASDSEQETRKKIITERGVLHLLPHLDRRFNF